MEDAWNLMKLPASISERFGEAAALVESTAGAIRIISHYDGDGISTAGILTRALYRSGKKFKATMVSVLEDEDIENIDGDFELLIVSDMGSSQADRFSRMLIERGARGIILDHHLADGRDRPFSLHDGGAIHEINPRFLGINGTTGCSGSTLAFLLALSMDPVNEDLCIFSLAGSLADRQHVPMFSELNLGVRELAVARGYLTSRRGMPFSGRNLLEALVTSNDPFIKGLSGNEKESRELLELLGMEPERTLDSLKDDELKVLHSYVYIRLLREGISPYIVHELFRENLFSERYGNLLDLAYSIDTCGRNGEMGKGVRVVWGDPEAYKEALNDRYEKKKIIQELLQRTLKEGANEMDHILWLRVEEKNLAGTIAGLAHNYLFDHEKPVIAISRDDGKINISGRADRELCGRGLNLAVIMKEAGSACGGGGGGHDVAAGGHIREDQLEKFLEICNKMVGEQLEGDSGGG